LPADLPAPATVTYAQGDQGLLPCGLSGADVPPYEGYAAPYHLFSVTFALAVLSRPVLSAAADARAGCLECAAAALVRRTPGCSPLVNSTPAVSNARRIASSLAVVSEVPVSMTSARLTVFTPNADARARSTALHPNKARAALICAPVSLPVPILTVITHMGIIHPYGGGIHSGTLSVWRKTMKSNLLKRAACADRRHFIGGSDARVIMGDDQVVLERLWREKRGECEPEDLSGNLIVQLGPVTERLNRLSASWVWRPCCSGPCRGFAT